MRNLDQIDLYIYKNIIGMQYQKQMPIVFQQNPAKYSAVLAYMASTIYDNRWDLSHDRYRVWGMEDQIKNRNIISIKNVAEIKLKNNFIKSIVAEINSIMFQSLKKLILDGNNIQTVQNLTELQSPSLEHLSINDNLITSFVSFRKCNFASLKSIEIKNNKLKQLRGLSQLGFRKLTQLYLQSSIDSAAQSEQLNKLCKTCFELEWIFITSKSRIGEYGSILRKKHKECEVKGKKNRRVHNIVANNYHF